METEGKVMPIEAATAAKTNTTTPDTGDIGSAYCRGISDADQRERSLEQIQRSIGIDHSILFSEDSNEITVIKEELCRALLARDSFRNEAHEHNIARMNAFQTVKRQSSRIEELERDREELRRRLVDRCEDGRSTDTEETIG